VIALQVDDAGCVLRLDAQENSMMLLASSLTGCGHCF
jgi:hypothetical protein